MSRYVSSKLKEAVRLRADFRCEYCKVAEIYSFLAFHIEHIVSIKHGGKTDLNNLAFSCSICNFNKGSDIATFLDSIKEPIRFFNPRLDSWISHFEVDQSGLNIPKTKIGEATEKILDFNHPDSIIERKILISKNIF